MVKKIAKVIFLIIAIIVIIGIIIMLRKISIIINIQKKVLDYESKDNNYCKMIRNDENITEIFIKDDVVKYVYTSKSNTEKKVIDIRYQNEYKSFTQENGKKTMTTYYPVNCKEIHNGIENYNIIKDFEYGFTAKRIVSILFAKIESVELEGIACYKISYNIYNNEFIEENIDIYYDKEKGLPLKKIRNVNNKRAEMNYTDTLIYEYQPKIVTDEDMKEPNPSEYEIVESNIKIIE